MTDIFTGTVDEPDKDEETEADEIERRIRYIQRMTGLLRSMVADIRKRVAECSRDKPLQ